jgi:hypothetical protein
MTEPRTEAGRRLVKLALHRWDFTELVIAIEAEASERLAREVHAYHQTPDLFEVCSIPPCPEFRP